MPAVEDRAGADEHRGWVVIEQAACLLILFLLGWRQDAKLGLTTGVIAGIAISPIWIGAVRRYRHGPLLFLAGGVTLAGGLVLTLFARSIGRSYAMRDVVHDATLWLGLFIAVGVILWARTRLSLAWIGCAFAAGMLLRSVTNPDEQAAENPWKFALSYPITIAVLALAGRRAGPACGGNRWLGVAALLALAAVSAALDSRSLFGTLVLAAILMMWQVRPESRSKPLAWGWTMALLAGVALAIYNVATS